MSAQLDCRGEERRARVRAAGLNGLDYVEVSDDQLTITVNFLEKAPEERFRGERPRAWLSAISRSI